MKEYIFKLSRNAENVIPIRETLEDVVSMVKRYRIKGFRLVECYEKDDITATKKALSSKTATNGALLDADSYNADVFAMIKTMNGKKDITMDINKLMREGEDTFVCPCCGAKIPFVKLV